MNKHIHNISIVVEEEWKCAWNCPGCELSLNKSDWITSVLSKKEIFEKIDYLLENKESLENEAHLLFHPGEILLQHSIEDIIEIFNYASKLWKPIQWEFTNTINDKLLEILENKKIQQLIIDKKLYLNIDYANLSIEKLKQIFWKIIKIWEKKIIEKHNINPYVQKMNELKELQEKTSLLAKNKDYIFFWIHSLKWKEKEIIDFLHSIWFEDMDDMVYSIRKWGTNSFYVVQWNICIVLHNTMNQKIDKYGNNIWDKKHIEGTASCLLMDTFELSLWANEKIIPHLNPCINHVKFWTTNEDYKKIKNNFYKHIHRIEKILIKYMYKRWFNQSELCQMCKTEIEIDVSFKDYLHFKYRKLLYKMFWKLSK